jgi:hypothetical protein
MTDRFSISSNMFSLQIHRTYKVPVQIVDELTLNYKGHHISKLIRESKKKSNFNFPLI